MLNKLQSARVGRIVGPPERQARASGGWTITPFTAVLVCIALSACQTYPSRATSSVSCSAARCDDMWRDAQAWIAQNSAYRIRLANDVVIETFGPLKSGPVRGLAYKLVKTGGAGRSGTISITSACYATIYGCYVDPTIGATQLARELSAPEIRSSQNQKNLGAVTAAECLSSQQGNSALEKALYSRYQNELHATFYSLRAALSPEIYLVKSSSDEKGCIYILEINPGIATLIVLMRNSSAFNTIQTNLNSRIATNIIDHVVPALNILQQSGVSRDDNLKILVVAVDWKVSGNLETLATAFKKETVALFFDGRITIQDLVDSGILNINRGNGLTRVKVDMTQAL